jgi:hypothetical protein
MSGLPLAVSLDEVVEAVLFVSSRQRVLLADFALCEPV